MWKTSDNDNKKTSGFFWGVGKAQEEDGEEDDIGNEDLEEDSPETRQMRLSCNMLQPISISRPGNPGLKLWGW